MGNKIYLVITSGVYDYEQFNNVEVATFDKLKAEDVFNQAMENMKNDFNDEEDVEMYTGENNFEIYRDGYAVEHSGQVELIEKEVQ